MLHFSLPNRTIYYFTVFIFEIRVFQALIWDITVKPKPIEDPILAFAAGGEVSITLHT
jgi:hypothetical protein